MSKYQKVWDALGVATSIAVISFFAGVIASMIVEALS